MTDAPHQQIDVVSLNMKTYTPSPLDTSLIEIPHTLLPLMEQLARNTHEIWSKQRINDGWKYGPVRNDSLKETPCLVEYEKLPESEKDYDRIISQETLKFILARGYKISQ